MMGPTIDNLDNCVIYIYCLLICYDMYINCKHVILVFVLYSVFSYALNISANINSGLVFNDANFKNCKENVVITFALINLDFALRIERYHTLINNSFP